MRRSYAIIVRTRGLPPRLPPKQNTFKTSICTKTRPATFIPPKKCDSLMTYEHCSPQLTKQGSSSCAHQYHVGVHALGITPFFYQRVNRRPKIFHITVPDTLYNYAVVLLNAYSCKESPSRSLRKSARRPPLSPEIVIRCDGRGEKVVQSRQYGVLQKCTISYISSPGSKCIRPLYGV